MTMEGLPIGSTRSKLKEWYAKLIGRTTKTSQPEMIPDTNCNCSGFIYLRTPDAAQHQL